VPRDNGANRFELRIKIERRIARAGKGDDLDVQAMCRRKVQQTRQRCASIRGGKVHEPTTHREDADDGKVLALGPRQKTLHFVFFATGDVLEQSESGDASPLERMTIRCRETCAGGTKVTLDTR
jgi:hypothetical protein